MFQGSITALITPFLNGGLDEQAFQDFVAWQIAEGSNGLVPVGTTGESPTLSHAEHKRVVALTVEVAKGRVPVIAGAGSNATAEAVDFARHARSVGANAVLVVTPYYNKPTQEGMYQHFRAVAEAVEDLPVIIYNIPARSGVDMTVETMARLARDFPNIRGVKDASNDLARPLATRLAIGPNFVQLSGEDATATAFLAQGGVGCISVTSNVAPALCAQMHKAWRDGDLETCFDLRDRLMPLHKALFSETSPGPVKYAVSLLDRARPETRLPLVPVAEPTKREIEAAMTALGLR